LYQASVYEHIQSATNAGLWSKSIAAKYDNLINKGYIMFAWKETDATISNWTNFNQLCDTITSVWESTTAKDTVPEVVFLNKCKYLTLVVY
jgi:hypothetical protein